MRTSAQQDLKDRVYERLMSRNEVDPETGCWIYTGGWAPDGMGRIRVAGKQYTASRVSAWVFKGGFSLDGPETVFHIDICLMPACFNPDHLRISDPDHHFLTTRQTRLIVLQATTMTLEQIAAYHNITSRTAWTVKRNGLSQTNPLP